MPSYFYRGRMESSIYDGMMAHHSKPITLSNMLNLIAQFGGYLNRKHDGEPGPTAIWIGLKKLRDFIKAKNVYNNIRS